jgi:methanogenic corrinoid protein MtbC1
MRAIDQQNQRPHVRSVFGRPATRSHAVNPDLILERLFQALITGDRAAARQIVSHTLTSGIQPEQFAHDIYWPLMENINALFRSDQLTMLAHHYATRLLRSLVDQAQPLYAQRPRRQRSILMFCGPSEGEELSAQLVADLAEADGYHVFFGGGGIANDEILGEIGERKPDILLMFSAAPSDAPNIRQLIDTIRGVNACPNMQIVVGGGVFNRAEGLAEEIGADLWAKSPQELLRRLVTDGTRRAAGNQRTVGRNRRSAAA